MDNGRESIDRFMAGKTFAVAGASEDASKYGHLCFAGLQRAGVTVYPLNPRAKTILGVTAYPQLSALPERVESLSIVTPPAVTEHVLDDAIAAGVQHVWMQPGAEPDRPDAVNRARDAGLTVIMGGPCLLVELSIRRK